MRHVTSVRDAEIAGRVIHDLAQDGRLNVANRVQVQVEGGVVRLTGTVDSAEQKQVAGQIARRVEGVGGVEDLLVVTAKPYALDDAALRAEAEAALSRVPGLDTREVGVEVADGIAHVVGRAPSAALAEAAKRAVGQVRGVKEVVNDLLIGEALSGEVVEVVDDATLRGEVGLALSDAGINVFNDATVVEKGVAYLRGSVFSRREVEEAGRLAAAVPGVQTVRNELVAEEEIPSRSPNEELAARVLAEIGREPRTSATYVKAVAYGGDVYLLGQVDSPEQATAAVEAARRVQGARRVLSSIVISDRQSLSSGDKGAKGQPRPRRRR